MDEYQHAALTPPILGSYVARLSNMIRRNSSTTASSSYGFQLSSGGRGKRPSKAASMAAARSSISALLLIAGLIAGIISGEGNRMWRIWPAPPVGSLKSFVFWTLFRTLNVVVLVLSIERLAAALVEDRLTIAQMGFAAASAVAGAAYLYALWSLGREATYCQASGVATGGVYRWTRNPQYATAIVAFVALGVAADASACHAARCRPRHRLHADGGCRGTLARDALRPRVPRLQGPSSALFQRSPRLDATGDGLGAPVAVVWERPTRQAIASRAGSWREKRRNRSISDWLSLVASAVPKRRQLARQAHRQLRPSVANVEKARNLGLVIEVRAAVARLELGFLGNRHQRVDGDEGGSERRGMPSIRRDTERDECHDGGRVLRIARPAIDAARRDSACLTVRRLAAGDQSA